MHGTFRLFLVFISPIVRNMCEHLHYDSVYFKDGYTTSKNTIEDNIQRGGGGGGAAVVLTISS